MLRFVVCGVNGYGAYLCVMELNKPRWAWAFGIIALLFNPFIPIHLNREAWAPIDLVVAVFLIASIPFVKEPELKD
jgi:hypothetical protein